MKKFMIFYDKISKNIFYLGEKNGISNSVKLALNLNIAAIYLALSEGIIFSMHSGIDPSVYLEIFNLSKLRTSISENKGIKILKKDFSPSFYLKHMLKDLNLVIETLNHYNYLCLSQRYLKNCLIKLVYKVI